MTMITALLIYCIALQIVDLITTIVGIRSGVAREANPVARRWFARVGLTYGVWTLKLGAMAICVYLWAYGSMLAVALIAGIYTLVIANNFLVLRKRGII